MSEVRLIDAEALKKQFENECVHNCYYCKLSKWDKKEACEYCGLIDNTPTVEPTFKPIAEVKFDEEQLQEIVDKAKAEVLASVERPQGEWIEKEETPMREAKNEENVKK